MMHALALETSGSVGSVAALGLADDQTITVLHRADLPAGLRTAQSLAPEIATLLQHCIWRPADVDLICVTSGPGSFTGLRIGVTMAKTLAYAVGAQLVGVHTLAALAAGCNGADQLWTVLDAQRRQLFVARFDGSQVLAEYPAPTTHVWDVDHWLAHLNSGDVVCGPPIEKLRDRLPGGVTVAGGPSRPTAEAVGRIGAAACQRGETVDPLQLTPNYFRKSAAEEKAERR